MVTFGNELIGKFLEPHEVKWLKNLQFNLMNLLPIVFK